MLVQPCPALPARPLRTTRCGLELPAIRDRQPRVAESARSSVFEWGPGALTRRAEATGAPESLLVRQVSVERVTDRIGTIPPDLMLEVNEALRLHLAI